MKIGIVGIGDVAQGNYLPFLGKQGGIALALFDRTQERAQQVAERFGAISLPSLEALAEWQPDTVLVLTNETTRYDVVSQLLQLGVPKMLCEKPLVAAAGQAHVTEEDFARGCDLLRVAREKNCGLAMLFNYRFFDQTLLAKRIAAERCFGNVTHLLAQVHYACWSHCIDLVRHFAGEFEEISALAGQVPREGQGIVAADTIAAFRMQNGATGALIGTAGMKWQHPLYEMHITFEGGRIHMRDIDGEAEVLDGAGSVHERTSIARDSSRWQAYSASFAKALTAYLQSIENGSEPPVTGMDGLRELQAEAAIKRSIAHSRPINVAKEFPLV